MHFAEHQLFQELGPGPECTLGALGAFPPALALGGIAQKHQTAALGWFKHDLLVLQADVLEKSLVPRRFTPDCFNVARTSLENMQCCNCRS